MVQILPPQPLPSVQLAGTQLGTGHAYQLTSQILEFWSQKHNFQCLRASILPLPLPMHWVAQKQGQLVLNWASDSQPCTVPITAGLLCHKLHPCLGRRTCKRNPRLPPSCQGFCFDNCLILQAHFSFADNFFKG